MELLDGFKAITTVEPSGFSKATVSTALLIVRELNRDMHTPNSRWDVNGDGYTSPLDALQDLQQSRPRRIYTDVEIRGHLVTSLGVREQMTQLRVPGGVTETRGLFVSTSPVFRKGETVLVFLRSRANAPFG